MSGILARAGAATFGALLLSIPAIAAPLYAPSGPQTGVSISTVLSGGWTQCFSETYASNGTSIASILSGCGGDLLMMAAGVTGSSTLDLLAWAPDADVTFNTSSSNITHNANGTEWYFSDSYSWGFAPGGAAVNRNSCDTASTFASQRLCWHTGGGNMNGGWRDGANTGLNDSTAYTRYLFTASSSSSSGSEAPEPSTLGMLLLAGLGAAAIRKR